MDADEDQCESQTFDLQTQIWPRHTSTSQTSRIFSQFTHSQFVKSVIYEQLTVLNHCSSYIKLDVIATITTC